MSGAPPTARIAIRVLDGPWGGRTVLVHAPVPNTIDLQVRRRNGPGTRPITYAVLRGPHGYVAQRHVEVDASLPTIGWRGWHLADTDGGLRLGSASYAAEWPTTGPLVAVHHTEEDPADDHGPVPSPGCSCGIYAARTLDWLRRQSYDLEVFGLVSLWGRFREHDQGWRYERAYPLALILNACLLAVDGHAGCGHIFGPEITATSDSVEHASASLLARLALLYDAYRVPVALGSPERGVDVVARLYAKGALPTWSTPVLPIDVRAAIAGRAAPPPTTRKEDPHVR